MQIISWDSPTAKNTMNRQYKTAIAVLITWCCIITNSLADDLPAFIHVCHRSDPNMELCLEAAVEDIRPYLVSGVPEYNIPSLEPLVLHELISEEVAGAKIVTSNVSAYGCSDFFVRGISIDKEQKLYVVNIDLPKLRILAHYSIDGKILLLPIKGSGNLEANVTDCTSTATLQGEFIDKNGQQYLRFVSNELKVNVGGGKVHMENLFNGDKVMLGIINDVVNKNFDAFVKELMPSIEKALSQTFLEIANDIVEPFTFEQLFPL